MPRGNLFNNHLIRHTSCYLDGQRTAIICNFSDKRVIVGLDNIYDSTRQISLPVGRLNRYYYCLVACALEHVPFVAIFLC